MRKCTSRRQRSQNASVMHCKSATPASSHKSPTIAGKIRHLRHFQLSVRSTFSSNITTQIFLLAMDPPDRHRWFRRRSSVRDSRTLHIANSFRAAKCSRMPHPLCAIRPSCAHREVSSRSQLLDGVLARKVLGYLPCKVGKLCHSEHL